MTNRLQLPLALALLAISVANSAAATEPQKHALLIGCTRYPNLPESLQLVGPGNDVLLMRDVLTNRFGFPPERVQVLAEDQPGGADSRPTRANIEQQFRRLAAVAAKNDQVVVLMAGHGSQQPDQDAPDSDDREPDGLDEIFLPADVGPWSGETGRVEQAIVDDDLRSWLRAILDKGASVWLIADACHSGTLVRGADQEVVRQVPPGVLVPESVLEAAQQRRGAAGEATRGRPSDTPAHADLARQASLVALYAAQSNEVTVEKSLPGGTPDSKRHGLLTYTISQVLTQAAAPLTYVELVDRVQARYVQSGRTFPTPLVEGGDRDREVLGAQRWPGRSRIVLRAGDDGLRVTAGALHGLTERSILAVFPPAGETRTEQPLGYVEIVEVRNLDAVVEPCAHGGLPADEKRLPLGGICEPVFVDCGDLRLRVAVDPLDNRGTPVPDAERARLQRELGQLANEAGTLIQVRSAPAEAQWLVRWDAGRTYLLPAAGTVGDPQAGKLPALFGPAPDDAPLSAWLKDRLDRIARASNLTRLTALSGQDQVAGAIQAGLELRLLARRTDREGLPVPREAGGVTLYNGDRVSFRLHNPNRFPIDMTLLYVDSGFGIACLFPQDGELNRLRPGDSLPVTVRVTADTAGLEHLVLVAVRATEEQPLDFSALAQPSLEQAQNVERTRGGPSRGLQSPLGQLLQRGLYGQGTARGVQRDMLDDHTLQLFSWHIRTEKRPPPDR